MVQTSDEWEKTFPAEKGAARSQSPCEKAVLSPAKNACFSLARQACPLHLHSGSPELKASFPSHDMVGTQEFELEQGLKAAH